MYLVTDTTQELINTMYILGLKGGDYPIAILIAILTFKYFWLVDFNVSDKNQSLISSSVESIGNRSFESWGKDASAFWGILQMCDLKQMQILAEHSGVFPEASPQSTS